VSEQEAGSCPFAVALELVQGVNLERLSESDRFFAEVLWSSDTISNAYRRRVSDLSAQAPRHLPRGGGTEAFCLAYRPEQRRCQGGEYHARLHNAPKFDRTV
jgi:hypothetical protein